MTKLAFTDIETTGLDVDRHEIWEIGVVVTDLDLTVTQQAVWRLAVNLGRADAKALEVGRYHQRWNRVSDNPRHVAEVFGRITADAHLVGVNPAFDDRFLQRFLRANGACPGWSYHLVDVLALAAGSLAHRVMSAAPPWSSSELSKAVGVDPDDFDRHTALGDALWAKAIYQAVMA